VESSLNDPYASSKFPLIEFARAPRPLSARAPPVVSWHMPFGIGLMELVVIFFILLLIFGANRLSGIGKGMGKAIRGFKDEVKDPNGPSEDS